MPSMWVKGGKVKDRLLLTDSLTYGVPRCPTNSYLYLNVCWSIYIMYEYI